MISDQDLAAIMVTLRLAAVTTVILLVGATPLAWWLATTRNRIRPIIESIVGLPLILPPTVLGFYLLQAMGTHTSFGRLLSETFGVRLAFSFTGLVIGSIFYSLPFVVSPLQNAFSALGRSVLETAASLGASPRDRFFSVALPLARPGYVTAAVLGFAHTVGEFGVVLMIGGNIPGETKVLSIAIYDHVEAMDYGSANLLSLWLLLFSFVTLVGVYRLSKRDAVVPA